MDGQGSSNLYRYLTENVIIQRVDCDQVIPYGGPILYPIFAASNQ